MSNVFSNMKIFPLRKHHETIVANGSVQVAGVMEVKFTVLRGSKGIFAKFPAKKGTKPDAEGKDIWYPDVKIINEDLAKEFQSLVAKELSRAQGATPRASRQDAAGEEPQVGDGAGDGIPF